jgi:hypothetical protein
MANVEVERPTDLRRPYYYVPVDLFRRAGQFIAWPVSI